MNSVCLCINEDGNVLKYNREGHLLKGGHREEFFEPDGRACVFVHWFSVSKVKVTSFRCLESSTK